MGGNPNIYKGCLLGMAVGDALGVTVDAKSYSQICQDYGPRGLLGYDLANGCASISSHTQVAALSSYYHGAVPPKDTHCLVVNYSGLTEDALELLKNRLEAFKNPNG